MSFSPSGKELTLERKMELIEFRKTHQASYRVLAEKFGISKSNVGRILKNETSYALSLQLKETGLGFSWDHTHSGMKCKKTTIEFSDLKLTFAQNLITLYILGRPNRVRKPKLTTNTGLNFLLKMWVDSIRFQSTPITGPRIQQKAKELAACLGLSDFKASSGWLSNFKRYCDISLSRKKPKSEDLNALPPTFSKEAISWLTSGTEQAGPSHTAASDSSADQAQPSFMDINSQFFQAYRQFLLSHSTDVSLANGAEASTEDHAEVSGEWQSGEVSADDSAEVSAGGDSADTLGLLTSLLSSGSDPATDQPEPSSLVPNSQLLAVYRQLLLSNSTAAEISMNDDVEVSVAKCAEVSGGNPGDVIAKDSVKMSAEKSDEVSANERTDVSA